MKKNLKSILTGIVLVGSMSMTLVGCQSTNDAPIENKEQTKINEEYNDPYAKIEKAIIDFKDDKIDEIKLMAVLQQAVKEIPEDDPMFIVTVNELIEQIKKTSGDKEAILALAGEIFEIEGLPTVDNSEPKEEAKTKPENTTPEPSTTVEPTKGKCHRCNAVVEEGPETCYDSNGNLICNSCYEGTTIQNVCPKCGGETSPSGKCADCGYGYEEPANDDSTPGVGKCTDCGGSVPYGSNDGTCSNCGKFYFVENGKLVPME